MKLCQKFMKSREINEIQQLCLTNHNRVGVLDARELFFHPRTDVKANCPLSYQWKCSTWLRDLNLTPDPIRFNEFFLRVNNHQFVEEKGGCGF